MLSRTELEDTLRDWVPAQRWFRAKSHHVRRITVEDRVALGDAVELLLLRVEHEGGIDDYAIVTDGTALDALDTEPVALAMLARFGGPPVAGERTVVRFEAAGGLATGRALTPRPVTTEQTNTSIVYGESFVLKVLRRLEEGPSPDMEMGQFLTHVGFDHAPALAGTIVVERYGRASAALGLLHRFTPNEGDAWSLTLRDLRAHVTGEISADRAVARAELLGRRIGQMHTALASRSDIPAFAPAPLDRASRRAMVASAQHAVDRAITLARLEGDLADVRRRLTRFGELTNDPIATRVHGDLHLGQVLVTPNDFVVIDFEGEPARSIDARRAKRPPLADVAGMLRSLHYAAMTVLREQPLAAARVMTWHRAVRDGFLRGWRTAAAVPSDADAILDFCVLEKCLYEVGYEADHRPDWLAIPLEGLTEPPVHVGA